MGKICAKLISYTCLKKYTGTHKYQQKYIQKSDLKLSGSK